MDLHLSILDGSTSCKVNDKRDDFEIVNFPYLDRDISRRHPSVFISRNYLGSPECLVILLTSTLEINY